MEKNLNLLKNKMMIIAKRKIKSKYGNSIRNYHIQKISSLLYSRNSSFAINYKEIMIFNINQEFNKRFYKYKESILKLIRILRYYINYLNFFCRPIFTSFSYNIILQNYYDIQADIFYRKNYQKKCEEQILKNDLNNCKDETTKSLKNISKTNSILIFDYNTRKYIETSTNILTSIDRNNDDKSDETYILKMKTSSNKYITIKNNDDYLYDLIETIKTKRKEKENILKNKKININFKFSLSQIKKKHSSKKNKFMKTNKILFNSNKNTIENNICTNYNNMKTITKKNSIEKNIYNAKIFNSNINLSYIKSKFKNKYIDSQKKLDKSQITKNKYSIGSGAKNKNLKTLKKRIIKKLVSNINNIKPCSIFNLYKRSSINIKYNTNNNIKDSNNFKMTSFSNYKNNSIINSNTNINKKIYNSNSNSPFNKYKKLKKKDNKSVIFNFSKNGKSKKLDIKKNLNQNISYYLLQKKNNKKTINKNINNYNINSNNDYINNNNINFTKIINQKYQNKKYICFFKKTSNNNFINKNQIKKNKNHSKNQKSNELYNNKNYIGKNDKNFLITNLSNYFNLKYLRSKSFLKKKPNMLNNLHTFSMRIIKKFKNHSNSGYININNQNSKQHFSINNIENYNYSKKHYKGGSKKIKSKNSCSGKRPIKICNNNFEKFTKNLNNIPNINLICNNQKTIDKNGINLNVNLNLNNINININSSSKTANKNTCSLNDKILDKLNLNDESNFSLFSNKSNYIQNSKQNKENNDNILNNQNYYSPYYKSRNKIQKISKKNIEKIVNKLKFNIKKIQNNSKQLENVIKNNNFLIYKKTINIKDKIKTNFSFNQTGINKTLSLINKKQIQEKTKLSKKDKKTISSFIINKRYKEINNNIKKRKLV